jgi:hypothetical protein
VPSLFVAIDKETPRGSGRDGLSECYRQETPAGSGTDGLSECYRDNLSSYLEGIHGRLNSRPLYLPGAWLTFASRQIMCIPPKYSLSLSHQSLS